MEPHPTDPTKGSPCGPWAVASVLYRKETGKWSVMLLDDLDSPTAMLIFDGTGPIRKSKYWLLNDQPA